MFIQEDPPILDGPSTFSSQKFFHSSSSTTTLTRQNPFHTQPSFCFFFFVFVVVVVVVFFVVVGLFSQADPPLGSDPTPTMTWSINPRPARHSRWLGPRSVAIQSSLCICTSTYANLVVWFHDLGSYRRDHHDQDQRRPSELGLRQPCPPNGNVLSPRDRATTPIPVHVPIIGAAIFLPARLTAAWGRTAPAEPPQVYLDKNIIRARSSVARWYAPKASSLQLYHSCNRRCSLGTLHSCHAVRPRRVRNQAAHDRHVHKQQCGDLRQHPHCNPQGPFHELLLSPHMRAVFLFYLSD